MNKKLLFVALAFLLVVYLFWVNLLFPLKEKAPLCQEVEVNIEGSEKSCSLLTAEQVIAEINAIDSIPLKKSITGFNLHHIEQQISRSNALIERCNLYFRSNGTLCVNIHTELPLFILVVDNKSYFVNRKFQLTSTNQANALAIPLPVVYGNIPNYPPNNGSPKDNLKAKLRQQELFEAISYIINHPKWGYFFSDYYIDASQNLYLSGAVAGYVVEIGRTWTNIKQQLNNLDLFLTHAEPKFGPNAFTKLNLVVPGEVIATPRLLSLSKKAAESITIASPDEEIEEPLPQNNPENITQ